MSGEQTVGLCAGMGGEAAVTLAVDTAAAVFGGVIALAGIAASLFLDAPDTAGQDGPAIQPARQQGDLRAIGAPGLPSTSANSRLRAAVKARALILQAARAGAHDPGRRS